MLEAGGKYQEMGISGLQAVVYVVVYRGSRKKINVRCIRFNINGEARAFLIAIRDIRKGERLYYDYNGMLNNYPTEHFE